MRTRLALLFLLLTTVAVAQKNSVPKEMLGMWDASLNNSTEEVPFRLEIKNNKGKVAATVWNGAEPWPFSNAKFENGTLTLRFEQYDGTLTAKVENGKLVGEYFRPYAKGVVHYPFKAGRDLTWEQFVSSAQGSKINGEFLYRLLNKDGRAAETGIAVVKSRSLK